MPLLQDSDIQYMRRCISIAAAGSTKADFPFGALVVHAGVIISEKHNEALDKRQVYRHAEMLALGDAQTRLSSQQMNAATLFSTVEPCAMCSFAARELGIGRIVFGLRSPIMGGYSHWHILQDEMISNTFPNTFGVRPEVVPDVLKDEVVAGWRSWDRHRWQRLVAKGVFR